MKIASNSNYFQIRVISKHASNLNYIKDLLADIRDNMSSIGLKGILGFEKYEKQSDGTIKLVDKGIVGCNDFAVDYGKLLLASILPDTIKVVRYGNSDTSIPTGRPYGATIDNSLDIILDQFEYDHLFGLSDGDPQTLLNLQSVADLKTYNLVSGSNQFNLLTVRNDGVYTTAATSTEQSFPFVFGLWTRNRSTDSNGNITYDSTPTIAQDLVLKRFSNLVLVVDNDPITITFYLPTAFEEFNQPVYNTSTSSTHIKTFMMFAARKPSGEDDIAYEQDSTSGKYYIPLIVDQTQSNPDIFWGDPSADGYPNIPPSSVLLTNIYVTPDGDEYTKNANTAYYFTWTITY